MCWISSCAVSRGVLTGWASPSPRAAASSPEGAITSRLVRLAGMAAPLSARPFDERGGPGQQAAPIHPLHGGGLHDGQQIADEEVQGQTRGQAVGELTH